MATDRPGPDWPAIARNLGLTEPEMRERASVRATTARHDAFEAALREQLGEAEYAAFRAWRDELFGDLAGEGDDGR